MVLFRYLRARPSFWFGLIAAFVGTIFSVVGLHERARAERNRRDFYPVTGTVIDTYTRSGSKGGTHHYLEVVYDDRTGTAHRASLSVGRERFESQRPEMPVELYVAGADPEDVWLTSDGPPSFLEAIVFGSLGALLVALGLGFGGVGYRRASRSARALLEGSPFHGRIVAVRLGTLSVNKVPWWKVTWGWTGFDGVSREVTSPHVPPHVAQRFADGQEVQVFVDRENPAVGEIDLYGVRIPA